MTRLTIPTGSLGSATNISGRSVDVRASYERFEARFSKDVDESPHQDMMRIAEYI